MGEDVVVKVMSDDGGILQLEVIEPKGLDVIQGELCKVTYQIPAWQLLNKLTNEDKRNIIQRVPVWKDNGIILLEPSSIVYFTMVKKKVVVHTIDNIYESNSSLEGLASKLSNREFYRCHRGYIVNIDYVDKIVPWSNATYMIKLKKETEQIPVSRHYAKELRNLLSI